MQEVVFLPEVYMQENHTNLNPNIFLSAWGYPATVVNKYNPEIDLVGSKSFRATFVVQWAT